MTVIAIKIPDVKAKDLSSFVKEIGGEVIAKTNISKTDEEYEEDNEVTHSVHFGENIKRAIKAFSK